MAQEPFGDIPLFREIQRLLAAGGGPVNYEIARQVAGAIAAPGSSEGPYAPDVVRTVTDSVASAEAMLRGYTRFAADEPLRAEVIGRSRWIHSTLDGWKWLMEHLAQRFTGELGQLGGPPGADAEANPMGAAMGQIAPLLMGIQVGTLTGNLAREVVGRYDLPIPRDDDGILFVVEPNVIALAESYEADATELRKWIAMHEAARGIIVGGVGWVGRYARSLLTELVDSIEIDAAELERRLMDLQSRGIESLQESGLGGQDALPLVPSERHRKALARVQAFLALFEGYAHHACRQIATSILSDPQRIDELMARRVAEPSEGEKMLASLLGLAFDRKLEQSGVTFCAAVASLKGVSGLNRVWEAPDNVPLLEEIKDPFVWMERVLSE
jgi:putative hydrolase